MQHNLIRSHYGNRNDGPFRQNGSGWEFDWDGEVPGDVRRRYRDGAPSSVIITLTPTLRIMVDLPPGKVWVHGSLRMAKGVRNYLMGQAR